MADGLSKHCGANKRVPSLALFAAKLALQHSHSQAPPRTTKQVAANHRSLCRTHYAASGQAQMVADLGLHHSPSQELLEPTYPETGFRSHQRTIPPNQLDTPKGKPGWYQNPGESESSLHTAASPLHSWPAPHSQLESQSHLLLCQQRPRLTYNRKAHTSHTRGTPEAPGAGDQGEYTNGLRRTPTT